MCSEKMHRHYSKLHDSDKTRELKNYTDIFYFPVEIGPLNQCIVPGEYEIRRLNFSTMYNALILLSILATC